MVITFLEKDFLLSNSKGGAHGLHDDMHKHTVHSTVQIGGPVVLVRGMWLLLLETRGFCYYLTIK